MTMATKEEIYRRLKLDDPEVRARKLAGQQHFWKTGVNRLRACSQYLEIKKAFLGDIGKTSWKTFYQQNIVPLNSEISFWTFAAEARRWKKEKWSPKRSVAEQKALNRLMAIDLLGKKLEQYVQDPNKVQEAELSELVKLYSVIRSEEDSEKNISLKIKTEDRKEKILNIFRILFTAGKLGSEDLPMIFEKDEAGTYQQLKEGTSE